VDHLYSLYDALVSINIPNDKARAVVDAMERDMYNRLATKADLQHVSELLSKDIQNQTSAMTVRLVLTAVALIPAIVAAQKLF
jgi:hypothetical protein